MSRIVHVSESLATGVLSVLATLASAQLRDGHEVVVVGSQLRTDTLPDWAQQLPEGVEFVDLPMEREIRPLADLRAALRLRELLRTQRPDVLHLHSSKAGALGRVAALGLGVRIIYQPHGLAYMRRDVSFLKRQIFGGLESALAMLGGTIVACSEGELAELRKLVRAEQAELVRNGIDLPDVAARSIERARLRIGTCGRVSPQKGPHFFAEVANELRDVADFVWIGDGDEDGKAALLNAGASVTGWRSRQQAIEEIAQLNIYVQTSGWEGMPISVLEAMAAGLPVVATDIAGNRDILQSSDAGFLVQTPTAMAERLRTLIEQEDLRERLGANACKVAVEHHSSRAMVRRYYTIYQLQAVDAPQIAPTGA